MSEKALLHAENYTVEETTERTTDDAVTGQNQQQQKAEGLKIEGLAVPFNKRSRNGVIYEEESIKKAAESLIGCSILFNHDENEPLGHVKDVEITDEGLRYEGDLNPERRETDSLKRGDIPNVSIQAMIEETSDDIADVAVTEFLELSAVTVPGFPSAGVETEGVAIESLMDDQDNIKGLEKSQDVRSEVPDEVTFEFEPIPKLVLYDNESDARQRAQDLGVQGIHQHEVNDEQYWMAGQTHGQWRQLVGLQEKLDNKESRVDESFSDYPDAAVKNARQALQARDNNEFDNDECGTQVGWERANQLDNGENLSIETVQRMHSFFERHDGDQEVNGDGPKEEDCGWLTWQAWGGDEAFEWATEKLEQIEDDSEEESTSKEPFAGYSDFEDCVQDNQDKEDPEAYCGAIKKKTEILGEKTTMTKEDKTTEQFDDLNESDFTGTVADMYEEISASDASELMEEFTFKGEPQPLVALMADLINVPASDLTDALMEMSEVEETSEEEGDYSDDEEDEAGDMDNDDEDDEKEEEESKESESSDLKEGEQSESNDMKTREELETKVEELEEKIMRLEDTEPSKQEAANQASTKSKKGFSVRKGVKDRLDR